MSNILILTVVILLILLIIYYYRYSAFNTESIEICGEKCSQYNVHSEHKNQESAAVLMDKIVKKNDILLNHLRDKYIVKYNGMNPDKENRIDVIAAEPMNDKYLIAERVNQLLNKYDKDQIYEISPLNKSGATSYTENKKILILCLREKKKTDGIYKLHNVNDMMFVVLHELAHMMNDKWGHRQEFWQLFKLLLQEGVECGVYTPQDYAKNPIIYCGMNIGYNPLYDNKI